MTEVPEFYKDHPEGAPLKLYKGGCHCRKFEFEYEYPSFDARPPSTCNCSYCTVQGEIVAYGKEANNPLKWNKGSLEETGKYRWNRKIATWHFCPECGVVLLWNGVGIFGINIRCFDDFNKINLDEFTVLKYDGANKLPGEPPKSQSMDTIPSDKKETELQKLFDENEPVSRFYRENPEGAEIITYKGGCHCRKFEYEFDYPRLDVRPPTVCNCSFCSIQGLVHAYGKPSNNPFRWISGSFDEAKKYNWNSKTIDWYFCPACGTLLLYKAIGMMGVNARCFDDFALVDFSKIPFRKANGAGQPLVSKQD